MCCQNLEASLPVETTDHNRSATRPARFCWFTRGRFRTSLYYPWLVSIRIVDSENPKFLGSNKPCGADVHRVLSARLGDILREVSNYRVQDGKVVSFAGTMRNEHHEHEKQPVGRLLDWYNDCWGTDIYPHVLQIPLCAMLVWWLTGRYWPYRRYSE